jgi:hypothetical protein
MKQYHRSIFRPDAVRCYAQSREKSISPRLASPRIFVLLWLFIGLLLAVELVLWFQYQPLIGELFGK